MHRFSNLRLVARCHWPVLIVVDTVEGVIGVERCKLEWNGVHEHEDASSIGVQTIKNVIDAICVVGEHFAEYLRVSEKGVNAKVVGADEDGIGRVGLRSRQV